MSRSFEGKGEGDFVCELRLELFFFKDAVGWRSGLEGSGVVEGFRPSGSF
jgi:hypothetical protein